MSTSDFDTKNDQNSKPSSPETTAFVYKIVPRSVWNEIQHLQTWNGSLADLNDGFVHLSTEHQLAGTLAKHFTGQADLVVLEFDTHTLGQKLKWEPSREGQLFPHLYDSLRMNAVLAVRDASHS